jgi:hypothetical protein
MELIPEDCTHICHMGFTNNRINIEYIYDREFKIIQINRKSISREQIINILTILIMEKDNHISLGRMYDFIDLLRHDGNFTQELELFIKLL